MKLRNVKKTLKKRIVSEWRDYLTIKFTKKELGVEEILFPTIDTIKALTNFDEVKLDYFQDEFRVNDNGNVFVLKCRSIHNTRDLSQLFNEQPVFFKEYKNFKYFLEGIKIYGDDEYGETFILGEEYSHLIYLFINKEILRDRIYGYIQVDTPLYKLIKKINNSCKGTYIDTDKEFIYVTFGIRYPEYVDECLNYIKQFIKNNKSVNFFRI